MLDVENHSQCQDLIAVKGVEPRRLGVDRHALDWRVERH